MNTPTLADDRKTLETGRKLAWMLYHWRNPGHTGDTTGVRIDIAYSTETDHIAAWKKAVEVTELLAGADLQGAATRIQQAERDEVKARLRDQSLDETHEYALRTAMTLACICSRKRESLDERHDDENCPGRRFSEVWQSLLHGM